MKKIIVMLGIAGMASFGAMAQVTNTGTIIQPTNPNVNNSPTPGMTGTTTSTVPNGYRSPTNAQPNTQYQSHYKQSGTKNSSNSTNTTTTPLSPTTTTPNPAAPGSTQNASSPIK